METLRIYDFLDKKPHELAPAPRIVLIGLRLWASAAKAHANPVEQMRALFQQWGLAAATWPAHNLFLCIGAHAERALALGCPSCGMASEDEALLLCILFPEPNTSETSLKTALSGLVADGANDHALRLAKKLRAEFNKVQGLSPNRPAPH